MKERVEQLEEDCVTVKARLDKGAEMMKCLDVKVNGLSSTAARIDENTAELVRVFALAKNVIAFLEWLAKIGKILFYLATPFIIGWGYIHGWWDTYIGHKN